MKNISLHFGTASHKSQKAKKFGSVESRSRTEEVYEHSVSHLKTNEGVILPIYMGRSMSRVKFAEVPSEVDNVWVIATLLIN